MTSPTYDLPACAQCSTIQTVSRPVWRLARHTTTKRGKNCYMLIGCHHVKAICDPMKIMEDPKEWAAVEKQWSETTAALLANRTANWSASAIERLKDSMEGRHVVPGTTRELALSEANDPSPLPRRVNIAPPEF